MKKLLATININYDKRITDITYPYMHEYAKKINADFLIIDKRKYENDPIAYEKFQIYDFSKEYDWSILIDSDAIIHPNCPDLTQLHNKDKIILCGHDYYPLRFKHNNYTLRDGRNIGVPTWLTVFSDWTRDLWKPFENVESYLDQITVMDLEKNFGYTSEHLITDYLTSVNVAKYGLKVEKFDLRLSHFGLNEYLFLIHEYCISLDDKVRLLKSLVNTINNFSYKDYKNIDSIIDYNYTNKINYL
jgi:hypothetical protein